jgi:hypothetical protein
VSDDPVVWIVAALEVLAAAGIAVFWITWFREDHDEGWLPAGYVEHESPFVFADSMLSVVLVSGAVLQVADEPAGRSLGLIAAGMLAFLGVLDLAYFARTGLFRRDRGGSANAGVVAGVLVLAAVLIVRFV